MHRIVWREERRAGLHAPTVRARLHCIGAWASTSTRHHTAKVKTYAYAPGLVLWLAVPTPGATIHYCWCSLSPTGNQVGPPGANLTCRPSGYR
jgi:hypothetical protein